MNPLDIPRFLHRENKTPLEQEYVLTEVTWAHMFPRCHPPLHGTEFYLAHRLDSENHPMYPLTMEPDVWRGRSITGTVFIPT